MNNFGWKSYLSIILSVLSDSLIQEAMFCKHSLIYIRRLKFDIRAAFLHVRKILAISVFKVVFA